jgi:hypothetical protein
MRLDGAMRALTVESENGGPADSFLRVLDQFAALHTYASATPTTGGYRLLGDAQRPHRKASKPSRARRVAIRPATAGARMRLTGSLSVLFIGGLGLAVLAGPASCPCSSTFAQQASLERLGYVQNAAFMDASEAPAIAPERVAFSDAEFLGPDTGATGISPITTSALEPAHAQASATDAGAAKTVGPLPSSIERVSEATPKTVKLAAATIVESDVIPELPVAEVAAPPMPAVTAVEAEHEVAPKASVRPPRKRAAARAYRTPMKQASRPKNSNDAMTAQRAPKWAQQMFTTPWQSQAFSYTR